jgi:hypothetical protein
MWESRDFGPDAAKRGTPSWSWATVAGEHGYGIGAIDYTTRAEVVSCKTTPVSGKNPFGEVTGGELVIRGHLQALWLDGAEGKLLDGEGTEAPDTKFISDGGSGDRSRRRTVVYCLVLGDKHAATRRRNYLVPPCAREPVGGA